MATRALILVEGHSGMGLSYILAAQQLGLYPITLSADPAQYCYIAAEKHEAVRVDTDNLDALVQQCSQISETYEIAGIIGFSRADESACVMAGKLCRHFVLPGPNLEAIEQCCDKYTQRQLLAASGVPIPEYRLATNAAEVGDSAEEIGLPVIIKPAAGSGSVGVRLCRTARELAEHTNYILGGQHRWGAAPRILVEEFANGGPAYGVDTMGDAVVGISTLHCGPPPNFVYRDATYPAALNNEEHERSIIDISLSSLRALGLGWGPAGIEVQWTEGGPVIIEVNPRLHGSPTPQMVDLAYGIDLITAHIKLAIGEELDLRKRHSQTAAARFLVADRDGTLDWIGGESEAAALPGVAEVKFYVQPKTPIVRKGDYRDCLGHVIAASSSLPRAEAILQRAVDLINWSITPQG
ncbi:acetyl-CoA carboxylase biotin carboxylase subunit family protein [Mesorhizobium sp. Cs1299R1N1]|uniref:ATP-grasp domain-containing protein n=1 Tax=Mesorhizobium sp. Cs1299R1N1 TaxID=3015172 RepID=UPI00301D6069